MRVHMRELHFVYNFHGAEMDTDVDVSASVAAFHRDHIFRTKRCSHADSQPLFYAEKLPVPVFPAHPQPGSSQRA